MQAVRALTAWQVLGGLAVLALGCGRGAERYTPSDPVARASLTAALDAWKAGKPPEAIANISPQVQVADTERLPGQKLLEYQVLSETAAANGRAYVVRLRLSDPVAEQRVRFIVIGIDPIWVFRKADFDRLAHWEHPMTEPAAAAETDEPTREIPPPP